MNAKEFLTRFVPQSLVVLIYREQNAWMAHCLDFDLVEPGKTIGEACGEVIRVAKKYIEHAYRKNRPDDLRHQAPKDLWDRVPRAKPLPARKIHLALLKQALNQPPVIAHTYKATEPSRKAAQLSSKHPTVALRDAERAFRKLGLEIRHYAGGDMMWGRVDGKGRLQLVGHKAAKGGLYWSQVRAILRKCLGIDDQAELKKREDEFRGLL